MGMQREPKFRKGDFVISFRGDKAEVIKVREVPYHGKSHRVSVLWDDPTKNPDNVEYYEEVFYADETRPRLN